MRVVHALGTGAFGEFVPSADISDLTKAKVFTPGIKTPVFVRFSFFGTMPERDRCSALPITSASSGSRACGVGFLPHLTIRPHVRQCCRSRERRSSALAAS